jgi:hypothetical protein
MVAEFIALRLQNALRLARAALANIEPRMR